MKVAMGMRDFCLGFVECGHVRLSLDDGADVTVAVQRVEQRLEVPCVKRSVKLSFELGHGRMLSGGLVVQVIEKARSDVVWNYYFVFGFAWREYVAVTCCD